MQIQLKVSGGFAYFPGLSQPIIVDTNTLPQQQADELKQLVNKVHFFDLPPVVGSPSPGAADYQQYNITVDDGNKHHTVQTTDPIGNPDLQVLIKKLQSHR